MEDYKVYVHIDPEGKRYYGSTKAKNLSIDGKRMVEVIKTMLSFVNR